MTRVRSLAASVLLPAVLMAACTGGGAAPASQSPASPSPVAASPSETPGAIGGGPGVTPIPIEPGGPGASAPPVVAPSPAEVQPVAGLQNVHDVRAESFTAALVDGRVQVAIQWWSGPPPCSRLAEVKTDRSGSTFTLTVREGASQLGIACPALAMFKQTTVDLGGLAPGSYTIAVTGVDQPQTVTVGAG